MKILVLQLKRIGDLVLTTPALVALRCRYPQARIVLAIMESSAGLAPVLPAVDEVVVVRRRGGNARLWLKLALTGFDLCLDFTGNDRSAFLSLLSKADRRIAFQWVQRSRTRALFYNHFVDSSVRTNHTVDHYLDLLSPLGVAREDGGPVTLALTETHRTRAATLLREAGVSGDYIVIHPGTARNEKYWLPEHWAEVIAHCRWRYRLPCLLTGTREPFERAHLEAILARSERSPLLPPLLDWSARLDLPTLAALIERAGLLLSMDSAPVHLGAAFGTRQISLFGPTNPFHWRARHPRAVTLLAGAVPGAPEPFAPRFERRNLSDLSTQPVIDAIGVLLA
ncbi:MAG TPA: glycosyltransferase family 9 protein [Chthoniobacteraceae bacterium]|nr:glycosyltransferase family 9 protein [Chthoniobacteraceae bacterium]